MFPNTHMSKARPGNVNVFQDHTTSKNNVKIQMEGVCLQSPQPLYATYEGLKACLFLSVLQSSKQWRIHLGFMNHVRMQLLSKNPVITQMQAYNNWQWRTKVSRL